MALNLVFKLPFREIQNMQDLGLLGYGILARLVESWTGLG